MKVHLVPCCCYAIPFSPLMVAWQRRYLICSICPGVHLRGPPVRTVTVAELPNQGHVDKVVLSPYSLVLGS